MMLCEAETDADIKVQALKIGRIPPGFLIEVKNMKIFLKDAFSVHEYISTPFQRNKYAYELVHSNNQFRIGQPMKLAFRLP